MPGSIPLGQVNWGPISAEKQEWV